MARPFALIWLLAFALRCVYLWQIAHAPFFTLRLGDAEAYHLWALRIAGGEWLGREVFYQAPLYPYVLAAIYGILGEGVIGVRLLHAAIGACSCTLLAAAGSSLFGRRGALAGVLLAIYPAAIFTDGLLEKSALVTLFVTALLALLATPPDRATARRWCLVGVVLGLLALTRENALVLIAPILLWVAAGPLRTPRNARLSAALLILTGCAVVLVPVAVRNAVVGHEFHLTTSQFGPNLYFGNHEGANGTYEALVQGHGSAADERRDATRIAQTAAGRTLTPSEVSAFWTARALDYIRGHPSEWLEQLARKAALTFNAAELVDTESQAVYADWSWLLRFLRPFDFGLLLGIAAFGTALTFRSWRRLWFLHAMAVTYALSVIAFYVFARYRFPLVPMLMILATGGLAFDGGRLAELRARHRELLAIGAAAALGAVAFAHLPLQNERDARAVHYLDIAASLSSDPARSAEAAAFYKRALDERPGFPAALSGVGMLLARAGRPRDAIGYYRAALESWPEDAQARFNLGLALAATGQGEEALHEIGDAVRIHPDDAGMHVGFGQVLITLQHPELAAEQFRQGLAIQPDDVAGLAGLGTALAQMGRLEEAVEKYRRALDLQPQNADAHNNLGMTLGGLGRVEEAIQHFERAVELNRADTNARDNLERARRMLTR